MSFVERSIILCPYIGGSTIGGSTVISKKINSYSVMTEQEVCNSSVTQYNEGLINHYVHVLACNQNYDHM